MNCGDPKCALCAPAAAWKTLGYTSAANALSFAPLGTPPPSPGVSVSTPTVSDFAGVDFCTALGEVYGLRMWKLDEHGRLRARNWDKAGPWRPGINVARCHADGSRGGVQFIVDPTGKGRRAVDARIDYYAYAAGVLSNYTSRPAYRVTWDDGSTEELQNIQYNTPKHDAVPVEECTCGFYAYTEPKHPDATLEARDQRVQGVIRGSGRTLIGTKGFRCEKAEIVALLDPTRGGRKKADWRQEQAAKLRRVYPDVPLLGSRPELMEFAPIESALPDPSTDEFWTLP